MDNKLLSSALIVFGFWFVVLYILSGFPASLVPTVIGGVAMILVGGSALGFTAAWISVYGSNEMERREMTSGADEGDAQATIMDGSGTSASFYKVRLPRPEPVKLASGGKNPLHNEPWWAEYKRKHPQYAAALNDVFALMQTKPGLPAGYNGGHKDMTLVQHSMNVVHAMLRAAPEWQFAGFKGKGGEVSVALADESGSPHTFGSGTPAEEPVLPLTAFAHDIGKVVCLDWDEQGKVVSVLPRHGERGARLLRRIPSVMALPRQDRDSLLLAVEFYHGMSEMPVVKWIGDRTRSLTALLYLVDCEASEFEGTAGAAEEAQRLYRTVTPIASSKGEEKVVPAATSEAPTGVAAATAAEAPASAATAPVAEDLFPKGFGAIDTLFEVLLNGGEINGGNRDKRIAFKHKEWSYIINARFLEVLQSFIESSPENTQKALSAILEALADRGDLLVSLGDTQKAPAKAIWKARRAGASDGAAAAPYQVFVVKSSAVALLENAADCPSPPELDASGTWQFLTEPPPAKKAEPSLDDYLDGTVFGDFAPDTGTHRRRQQARPVARMRPPLTVAALEALGKTREDLYGREFRAGVETGREFVVFKADELACGYEFDLDNLPPTVKFANGYLGIPTGRTGKNTGVV